MISRAAEEFDVSVVREYWWLYRQRWETHSNCPSRSRMFYDVLPAAVFRRLDPYRAVDDTKAPPWTIGFSVRLSGLQVCLASRSIHARADSLALSD